MDSYHVCCVRGRKMAKWMKANYARILWERHQGAIRIQACARMFLAKLLLVRLREEHKLRVKYVGIDVMTLDGYSG